jgi:NTE family protein
MQLPDSVADSALARLFASEALAPEVSWFSLPGGQSLCEAGEPADQLFFLRAGRLGAIRREEGQEPQFLGVIRPGEPAGEMAMISGERHTATVVALRDSEILAMPRRVFLKAAEANAGVTIELARLMMLRARQTTAHTPVGEPSVFGFIALTSEVAARDLVEALAAEIEGFGYTVAAVGAEAQQAPTEWFSNLEQAHDFVLYAGEADQAGWKQIVGRQVDRLFRIGRGDRAPPAQFDLYAFEALESHRFVDLVLLQPSETVRPQGSEAWMDTVRPARLFHLRSDSRADLARLARILAGTSVGLVLSGGGARALAHIGAIRALHAADVPIDFVGGSSMGAIIAAALAMGWDDAEIDWRIRKAFVETSPVDDIAFPIIAMTRGEKVRLRLTEHFGDQQIADLWLPFFCLSSNLTSGAYQLHQRGELREALRASIAIPGLLPPIIQGDDVLVDGAVMKNFPAEVMRAMHLGPLVGVDVTRGRSITAADVARPASVWRWILSGQWRKGPPIVSLLLRAATVSTARDAAASREASDVLVLPAVDDIDIRDWDAYAPAVEAGRRATELALTGLGRPVTDLRRRRALGEAAAASVSPG